MSEDLIQKLIVFSSAIVFTALIVHFKLKKKELEMRARELGGSDPELGPVVDALRDDLANMQDHTRAQLADMKERLDFAERLLTAGRASQDEKGG